MNVFVNNLLKILKMEEYHNSKYYRRRFLFILYAYLLLRRRRTLRRRTVWVRSIFHENQREIGAQNLIKEMCLAQPDKYYNYLRMAPEEFDCLFNLIGPYITK